jgi:hypothetical protein
MEAFPQRADIQTVRKFVDSQESLLSFGLDTALTNYHDLCGDSRSF